MEGDVGHVRAVKLLIGQLTENVQFWSRCKNGDWAPGCGGADGLKQGKGGVLASTTNFQRLDLSIGASGGPWPDFFSR
jgi:hypothetical protein